MFLETPLRSAGVIIMRNDGCCPFISDGAGWTEFYAWNSFGPCMLGDVVCFRLVIIWIVWRWKEVSCRKSKLVCGLVETG